MPSSPYVLYKCHQIEIPFNEISLLIMLKTSCQRDLIKEKTPLSQGTHVNMETFMKVFKNVKYYTEGEVHTQDI